MGSDINPDVELIYIFVNIIQINTSLHVIISTMNIMLLKVCCQSEISLNSEFKKISCKH